MAATALVFAGMTGCGTQQNKEMKEQMTIPAEGSFEVAQDVDINQKLAEYASVELTADISHLTANEKQVVSILYDVADIMEELYWKETVGNRESFLNRITDEGAKKFATIQYGPWNRLDANAPFLTNVSAKPAGANFYPVDMTREEFEALQDPNKESLYTLIRRDEQGALKVVWYHEAFANEVKKASDLLKKAAALAEDAGLKKYLELRAEALLTDNYQPSDFAWMDMRTSNIDFVVGPIENYEDAMFGYKAAHESFVLIKDNAWSKRLEKYASLLPALQKGLPVPDAYKQEVPGSDADMNAYDVLYYRGDCNAGSKTIAINLPNDEQVQLAKGSRKLQLKNAMKAKFDKILVPISNILIDPAQRKNVTFDAFFANTMFHEVAHGMGIKNTLNDKGTCRGALKEVYSSIEEGKADIMGLYLVSKLYEQGEYTQGELMDNFVTFFAGIFRSSRFGAASSHGKANMMRFNYFAEKNAFTRNEDGTYTIHFEPMKEAMIELIEKIIVIQGDGNYDAAKQWVAEKGIVVPQLQEDLDRLNSSNIPVDIVYEQGKNHIAL